jgi:hypothetical protein
MILTAKPTACIYDSYGQPYGLYLQFLRPTLRCVFTVLTANPTACIYGPYGQPYAWITSWSSRRASWHILHKELVRNTAQRMKQGHNTGHLTTSVWATFLISWSNSRKCWHLKKRAITQHSSLQWATVVNTDISVKGLYHTTTSPHGATVVNADISNNGHITQHSWSHGTTVVNADISVKGHITTFLTSLSNSRKCWHLKKRAISHNIPDLMEQQP